MSIKVSTIAAAVMIIGAALPAAALEGYDGDNNPIPGFSSTHSVPASAFAARIPDARPVVRGAAPSVRRQGVLVGETRADQPDAVYWRGRYLGTDPDSQVRLRMLREAMGG